MPCSTRRSITNEPGDINFAYFLAKPLVGWHPIVTGMHSWMQSCSVAHAAWQKEWFGFVERRLHADAEQMKRFNTETPEGSWRMCYEFFEQAMDDYRTEYGQLATLGTNLVSETVSLSMQAMALPGEGLPAAPAGDAEQTAERATAADSKRPTLVEG